MCIRDRGGREDARGDGRVAGALHRTAIDAVDAFDRGFRTAGDVMAPADDLPRVHVDAPLYDVLHLLQDHRVVAITDDDVIVGLVDSQRAEELLRSLDPAAP